MTQQLTEQDYRALCASLEQWCKENPVTREQEFQWRFVGAFHSDPETWSQRYDPQQYIVRFLTHDVPTDLAVEFYMRELASGQGEFMVAVAAGSTPV